MKTSERIIRGAMASAGIAVGHAIRAFDPLFISFNFRIKAIHVPKEVARFRDAVEKSRQQLRQIQVELKLRSNPESSFLVDAHLLILEDRLFVDRIVEKIQSDCINSEWAIQLVSDELFEAYDRVQDEYLRERRGDLEDIVRRLLHNLGAKSAPPLPKLPYGGVLVGKTIPPSALFEFRAHRIVGLVTETGSPLSHTAIVARSLEIPAVMGVEDISGISSGDLLVVDGRQGLVIVFPSEDTLRDYRQRTRSERKPRRRASAESAPCVTADGVRISLGANINFGGEVQAAVEAGSEFIGLYRTEFDFFREEDGRDEDGLTEDYAQVLKSARSMPVTFRTIDVGIDRRKWDEVGSGFGIRGLRFCLENPDLFRTQLRALLRSSIHGKSSILLPFVSTIDDLDAAVEIIADVKRDLERSRHPFDPDTPVGVMIETPAAAQTCDLMAARVDFFCLGTNDLIQYYLAIDRSDQSAVHLYNPFHPAILRCLDQVRRLLEPTGKPITVCGEMAADPPSAAVLLGLGFTSLSVNLAAYERMKHTIGSMAHGKLRELADEILKMEKPGEVESRVRTALAIRSGSHP